MQVEFPVGVEQLSNPNYLIKVSMQYLLHMNMILFGALSAGTKTYLLCRSDRHAFTSAFCNTLPVGCLRFCFSLEIRSSIWPFTISSKMIELKALLFPV